MTAAPRRPRQGLCSLCSRPLHLIEGGAPVTLALWLGATMKTVVVHARCKRKRRARGAR